MTTQTDTLADRLEQVARATMTRIAAMPERGYDTAKAKADERSYLDDLLDAWNEHTHADDR